MSPAISMSAIEILPALLNKTKVQTIRPLFCDKCKRETYDNKALQKQSDKLTKLFEYHCGHKPRLKVGQKVKIYWKMRSKAKWFDKKSGTSIDFVAGYKKDEWKKHLFPKLLGEVEITEVFEIEMLKEEITNFPNMMPEDLEEFVYNCFDTEGNDSASGKLDEVIEDWADSEIMAKRDGFESERKFWEYFDKAYDLSQPRRFCVYRWKWL